ncbi:MAG: hypothetical protein ICV62_13905 [Cyanobacteria bacterium Co-bin13]|nr:hypothetical protein [Cyanobacteria bacterium Co-bin13]
MTQFRYNVWLHVEPRPSNANSLSETPPTDTAGSDSLRGEIQIPPAPLDKGGGFNGQKDICSLGFWPPRPPMLEGSEASTYSPPGIKKGGLGAKTALQNNSDEHETTLPAPLDKGGLSDKLQPDKLGGSDSGHLVSQETQRSSTSLISGDTENHYDWPLKPLSVQDVQKHLIEVEPDVFLVRNVANSRVSAAVKTADWLHHQTAPKTVGRMREDLQSAANRAIDPQDWWNLDTVLPYRVEITWSSPAHTGNYDVLLLRHGVDVPVDWPRPEPSHQAWDHYTNDPLQAQFARQLIPDLRQYLGRSLPDYMVPAAFIPLAALPLTTSGKLDRRALPAFSEAAIRPSGITTAPSTPTEATLAEIWKELLRLKHVNTGDNFFELGGHSLLATQMTSRVRDALEVELPLKNVFEAPTIAQLAPMLDALRNAASTPEIPPLVRLDRAAYRRKRSQVTPQPAQSTFPSSSSQARPTPPAEEPALPNRPAIPEPDIAPPHSPLVPLTLASAGASKPPFFCVHPMFGVVFPYLELAHHLDQVAEQHPHWGNRSFYGLQPLGLDGKSKPLTRIEAIATHYVQAIQSVQPRGPYFLGGWSFGGLVAFEMAQQLTQAGQQVGLLAILDTPAPGSRPSFYQNLRFLLGTALWSTLPFLVDYSALAANRLRFRLPWLSRWQWTAIARQIPEESRLRLADESAIQSMLPIVYANSQAAYRYVPKPYANPITLFKAAEQSDAIGQDATLGWSALASNIQLHQVPGNHLSLLKQPHVQTLAQQMGQCLAEY